MPPSGKTKKTNILAWRPCAKGIYLYKATAVKFDESDQISPPGPTIIEIIARGSVWFAESWDENIFVEMRKGRRLPSDVTHSRQSRFVFYDLYVKIVEAVHLDSENWRCTLVNKIVAKPPR